MTAFSPVLTFKSANFKVEVGEDESTNPGLFGKALAGWLGKALVDGFTDEGVIAEDFGWLVTVPHPKHALYVACVSSDETATEWKVYVFAEGAWIQRMFKRLNLQLGVDELYARVKALLASTSGISIVDEELQ
jgi:hypothetical protein